MSCTLSDSCKAIIDSKNREIRKTEERIEDLELEIKEYENREKMIKIFLIIQAGLLAIAFQVWD